MTPQDEVNVLNEEYEKYIKSLWFEWKKLPENRVHSKDVYEVMSDSDRSEVHAIMKRWPVYVTPFAEAWWKERGYEVFWPEDNSEPMKMGKLETV